MRRIVLCGFCWMLGVCAVLPSLAAAAEARQTPVAGKPRLVMVEVPSWKNALFGLPRELPLLIAPGEAFNPQARHYDYSSGLEAMEILLAIRPKDPHAKAYRLFIQKWPRYQKFFQAVEKEDYAAAEEVLNQILQLDPEEPAVHFYLGSLNTQLKKYAEAEKNYRACLKRYPDYGPAYINLARLVKARGDDDEARKLLTEAVKRLEGGEQQDALQLARTLLQSLDKP
ncbi:MAG: tetratricopeptide repeat protein [candidate division FCPU426 bacterium]